MADKFINDTGLQTIKTWANSKFATGQELSDLQDEVDGIIAEGGEPNVIETVKVDGTALVPDANKAVNIDLSDKADVSDIPTNTSDLTNDGDGTSNFATENYVDTYGGKIDKIKVNNVEQTITNKTVNIPVPTEVSDLTNDSGYQTASDVQTAISAAVASAYRYKGSVATVADLPASGNTDGDVWDVQATGMNYAWNGTAWDTLGQYVDTSVFWTSQTGQSNTLVAMTVAEINAILNA